MSGRNALLGSSEVQALIGSWQSIIGSGAADPFRDILGAETYYRQPPAPAWHPHHHHRWGYQRPYAAPYAPPYAHPAYAAPFAPYAPPVSMTPARPVVRDWRMGADDDGGMSLPPRNELVDRPGPTRADRVLLPMSSGVNILPNTSAQITSRPQNVAFRPERVIIGGTPGDWIVNDIKVGNRSQFSQSGDVPGEVFANTTIDAFVSFETVQTAMDFVMLVTYIGASESGAPFYCAVLGTAAI